MTFLVKYSPLFQLNVLHNFFLNKGLADYNSMSLVDKTKQLERYDVLQFLKIIPTHETAQKIRGHNLVFKMQNNGFALWSKVTGNNNNIPFIDLSDELSFTFCVQITDSAFYNYTNLNLSKTDKLHYFSNKRLSTELGSFPLIDKNGDNNTIDDSFILSVDSLKEEMKVLDSNEKENLFALIRIFVKGQTGAFNMTNAQGRIKNPNQEFELLFENRKTSWRYIFDTDQTVTPPDDLIEENGNVRQLVSKAEQPLTSTGFISLELGGTELPNPDARMIKPDETSTKYYSEIYM